MDYKWAKQLKDAGFVQEGKGEYIYKAIGSICRKESKSEVPRSGDKSCCNDYDCAWQSEEFYIPTLSELIEACGKDLNILTQIIKRVDASGKTKSGRCWEAMSLLEVTTYGKTLDIAVAKLWLALNKK